MTGDLATYRSHFSLLAHYDNSDLPTGGQLTFYCSPISCKSASTPARGVAGVRFATVVGRKRNVTGCVSMVQRVGAAHLILLCYYRRISCMEAGLPRRVRLSCRAILLRAASHLAARGGPASTLCRFIGIACACGQVEMSEDIAKESVLMAKIYYWGCIFPRTLAVCKKTHYQMLIYILKKMTILIP